MSSLRCVSMGTHVEDLYLYNDVHQLVVADTGVPETYDADNWATYAHAETKTQGSSGYRYFTISESLPVGGYFAVRRMRAGASAAETDIPMGSGCNLYWDGANWFIDRAMKLAASTSPETNSPEEQLAAAKTAAEAVQAKLPAGGANMHAAGAAVAKSPATIDWTSDVSNKPTIGTSTLTEVDVRTAVGLAAANIDTQLAAIQSAADAAGQPMTVNLSGEAITLG